MSWHYSILHSGPSGAAHSVWIATMKRKSLEISLFIRNTYYIYIYIYSISIYISILNIHMIYSIRACLTFHRAGDFFYCILNRLKSGVGKFYCCTRILNGLFKPFQIPDFKWDKPLPPPPTARRRRLSHWPHGSTVLTQYLPKIEKCKTFSNASV